MEKLKSLLRQKEVHILLFGLCLILFNWPFLTGVYKTSLSYTFLSLFLAWAIIIALLYLLSTSYGPASSPDGDREERRE